MEPEIEIALQRKDKQFAVEMAKSIITPLVNTGEIPISKPLSENSFDEVINNLFLLAKKIHTSIKEM